MTEFESDFMLALLTDGGTDEVSKKRKARARVTAKVKRDIESFNSDKAPLTCPSVAINALLKRNGLPQFKFAGYIDRYDPFAYTVDEIAEFLALDLGVYGNVDADDLDRVERYCRAWASEQSEAFKAEFRGYAAKAFRSFSMSL